MSLGVFAMAPSVAAMSDAQAQARRYLDRLLADDDAPGLQYLFLSDDAVLYSHTGGMADLVNREPVTDLTTFNAYSVTKTFAAAAILQLAEQGKVGLDRPIAQYLDQFPYDKSPTIRETLTHTGGFPNPNPMPWVHLAGEHAAFDKAQFVGEVLRSHNRLKSEPGRTYAYSNVGYLLLGEVIEKVSGQAFTEYVEQHLIRPLRLRDGETLAFAITRPQDHARCSEDAIAGVPQRTRLFDGLAGSANEELVLATLDPEMRRVVGEIRKYRYVGHFRQRRAEAFVQGAVEIRH